jgi:uncharacterized protein YbjT (DUF2867 family)
MKVVVFGATGRTGRHVAGFALERGYELRCFVREFGRLEHAEGVEVVSGDARNTVDVEPAVEGADAIISVLSLAKPEDEPAYSDATSTIIGAAERAGVRRIVITANNHAFNDDEVTGEFAAQAREHRRNRDTVRASSLAWTILAAPWVTDDDPAGAYEAVVDAKGPNRRIASADLALAVVDALERDGWVRHVVGVSAP